MTLPSPDIDRNAEPVLPAVVFRGSKLLCREFSLVLEARGIEHEVREYVQMLGIRKDERTFSEGHLGEMINRRNTCLFGLGPFSGRHSPDKVNES